MNTTEQLELKLTQLKQTLQFLKQERQQNLTSTVLAPIDNGGEEFYVHAQTSMLDYEVELQLEDDAVWRKYTKKDAIKLLERKIKDVEYKLKHNK